MGGADLHPGPQKKSYALNRHALWPRPSISGISKNLATNW